MGKFGKCHVHYLIMFGNRTFGVSRKIMWTNFKGLKMFIFTADHTRNCVGIC